MFTFQSALRFAVVSDRDNRIVLDGQGGVSIRFKVRGGFRRGHRGPARVVTDVSIRFKVRGGFRRVGFISPLPLYVTFQSALRFAVVSDPKTMDRS